jgi:hypothetical protein
MQIKITDGTARSAPLMDLVENFPVVVCSACPSPRRFSTARSLSQFELHGKGQALVSVSDPQSRGLEWHGTGLTGLVHDHCGFPGEVFADIEIRARDSQSFRPRD